MPDVDSAKRYDNLISFHGQELLSSLGLPAGSGCLTVRDLVEQKLLPRLQRPHRWPPTVFYDSVELNDRVSDLFDAILQLRGGGVALVLLTARYLTRKYCLAELRALLYLARLSRNSARQGEAVVLRFVCLEPNRQGEIGVQRVLRIAKEMATDEHLRPFVDDLNDYVIQSLTPRPDPASSLSAIALEITDHVWKYWDDDVARPNIGSNLRIAFLDMQRFFDHKERRKIGRVLGIDVAIDYEVQDVIDTAVRKRVISYHSLNPLLLACEVCNNGNDAAAAIRFFQRRWYDQDWSWSSQTKDVFVSFVKEAEIVLSSWRHKRDPEADIQVDTDRSMSSLGSEDLQELPVPEYVQDSFTDMDFETQRIDRIHTRVPRFFNAVKHTVFIAFAGVDKEISIAVGSALLARGIRAYVYRSTMPLAGATKRTDLVFKALETATIGVFLLSPEFAARPWPMRELKYFLHRHDESTRLSKEQSHHGLVVPILIPVFYRLSNEACKNDQLHKVTTAMGHNVFMKERFFDFERQRETPTVAVLARLRRLADFVGVRLPEVEQEQSNGKIPPSFRTQLHCAAVGQASSESNGYLDRTEISQVQKDRVIARTVAAVEDVHRRLVFKELAESRSHRDEHELL